MREIKREKRALRKMLKKQQKAERKALRVQRKQQKIKSRHQEREKKKIGKELKKQTRKQEKDMKKLEKMSSRVISKTKKEKKEQKEGGKSDSFVIKGKNENLKQSKIEEPKKEGKKGWFSSLKFWKNKKEKHISKQPLSTVQIKAKKEKRTQTKKLVIISSIISIVIGLLAFLFTRKLINSLITLVSIFILMIVYNIVRKKLKYYSNIKKMESVFPDFLQLMSSNLRAGMTIDRSLLLSSRKEFAPLDKEILKLGKDIVTGNKMETAMKDMATRIKSDKISKTIELIISGIRSGGNLAVLLEETSSNMRERSFVEKKSASGVLMYVIFVFFAIAVGAPLLFALSTVLVDVMTELLANIPEVDASVNVPFTLSSINISTTFIIYFSLIFLIVTDILGSLVLGLVSKGHEREGLKYLLPIITLSLTIFFLVRILLADYFSGLF